MSIIVHVEPSGNGWRATARQGAHEYEANASSPELAARLAAAGLTGRDASEVRADRQQPGIWRCTFKGGAR